MIINKMPKSPLESTIWRYMDFTKFISLIDTQSLFFTRSDKFEDRFEGSYTLDTIEYRRIKHFGAGKEQLDELAKVNSKIREYVYINCWHMNEFESAAMWNLYLNGKEGIAIRSTMDALTRCFVDNNYGNVYLYNVEYIDYDKYIFDDKDILDAFRYKRKSFEYEREIRALISRQQYSKSADILNDPKRLVYDNGINKKIDINTLIQNIYVSPLAQEWFYNLVYSILKIYDDKYDTRLQEKIRKSDLIKDPIY